MIRLDEKQYRAVKKMTRAACANNDCGNCLLLDDGETCVCVQSISYSLLCRYFREAVLPADRQLCEQITRSGETDLKRCAVCGSTFAAGSNRAKYCPDCAAKIRRRQKAKIAGQDRKVFTDKAAMEKYLNGRIKAYDRLFTEISPPIPQEYADYFKVNGMLMPDYTIEGEEPPQQQQQAAAIPETTGQEKEREHMSEQFSIMIGNQRGRE